MRTLAALSLAALAAGCSLSDDTVLVAMLVESPAPPPGLGLTVTQTSMARVFLGQTSVTSPSAGDVRPISGATVQLYDNGALVTAAAFTENPPGYYQATGDFYVPAHTYRLVARVGSDEYWGEVRNAPSAPSLSVPGMNGVTKIAAYANYSDTGAFPNPYPLTRACPPGGLCDVAFYGVWSVTGTSLAADPNCTNAPQDAAALLQLAFVSDLDWRAPTFSVSKSACFPAPATWPGGYVVGLTALKRGTTSSNTSVASAALAGTSDGAGVTVALP